MRHTETQYTPWRHLIRLRMRAGMRKQDLAEAAGLSLPYIYDLERGRRRASDENIFKLAELFDVDAADLGDSRPPVPPRIGTKPGTEVA